MKSENTQRSIFQLAAQSSERVQKFIDSIHNQSYVQSLSKGSIPLIHPDFHEFVDRSHDPHKPIYLTKYKPAKLRAQDSCDDYHANHLPAGPYQKLDMQRRTENLALEKHPLRYGVRTENERLLQSIQGNSIDHSMKDMSIYHFPDWKPTHHEKWTSQQTFLHQPKNFQNSSAWEKIPLRLAKDNNIYYDQEDDFKRTKNVQNKQTPFNPVIKKDPYPMYSQSIRTGKQDEAFGMEDKAVFSENNQLKQNYKNALIKTKSVDHIIPYNHSNKYKYLFKQLLGNQKFISKCWKIILKISRIDELTNSCTQVIQSIGGIGRIRKIKITIN